MASRPFPMPGKVPIPRHFSKGFSSTSRTTRIPPSWCSKRSKSPGLTPSERRISTGIVICPLLVTLVMEYGAGTGFAAVAIEGLLTFSSILLTLFWPATCGGANVYELIDQREAQDPFGYAQRQAVDFL